MGKRQWKEYVGKKLKEHNEYEEHLSSEVLGLNDIVERLETTYKMGHKGVHEDWRPQVFTGLALRIVLLVNDVLAMQNRNGVVKFEPDLFQNLEDLDDRE